MNQCDGCRASRPLVMYRNGSYWVDPHGTAHIMGQFKVDPNGRITNTGYADLMSCCKAQYKEE